MTTPDGPPTTDHAHTPTSTANRRKKASALAAAAASLGLQPYELTCVGGTVADADRRRRVRRAAGLDRDASVETWQLALGFLEARVRTMPSSVMCPACGWPVLIVTTDAGVRLFLDPFPREDGTVWPHATPQGTRARVIAGHETPPDGEPLFRQHQRSCPADKRAPARRLAEAPKCSACGLPLDPVLAQRDRSFTAHPNCEGG
ncbi:hypothetical protein ACTHAM_002369 [Cellulomonas soli]|uniref:hypothetical protein n=1 Tax=Cellulomonas soli TaxID=931535 RepID=UPI003F83D9C8